MRKMRREGADQKRNGGLQGMCFQDIELWVKKCPEYLKKYSGTYCVLNGVGVF